MNRRQVCLKERSGSSHAPPGRDCAAVASGFSDRAFVRRCATSEPQRISPNPTFVRRFDERGCAEMVRTRLAVAHVCVPLTRASTSTSCAWHRSPRDGIKMTARIPPKPAVIGSSSARLGSVIAPADRLLRQRLGVSRRPRGAGCAGRRDAARRDRWTRHLIAARAAWTTVWTTKGARVHLRRRTLRRGAFRVEISASDLRQAKVLPSAVWVGALVDSKLRVGGEVHLKAEEVRDGGS